MRRLPVVAGITISVVSLLLLGGCAVTVPPPPDRVVIMGQRPVEDAVWVPGHWRWACWRHHYVWVNGYWHARRHNVWIIIR